jgi:uncharacterized protein (TIGR02246 family)
MGADAMKAILLAMSLCAAAAAQTEEAAVRGVIAKYVEAREKIDPTSTEALFTADADQHVSSGEWRRGRAAVVQGSMASSRNNAARRTIAVETVRFLTPDVALADGRYELAGVAETRKMWTAIVLKKEAGVWRIAAIRNMLPSAPQQP